jgi:hypothetical protein
MPCANYHTCCYSRRAAYIELRCPVLLSRPTGTILWFMTFAPPAAGSDPLETGTASSITLLGSTVAVL